ncbi:MAG: hypothetical protein H8F28_15195 [Fibrella sp.]|nr:hypothetical protein [Armatimonadota bacterium]
MLNTHATPEASDESFCTPSAQIILSGLAERFSGIPVLALGQTALWDEPTKASLRYLLDRITPQTEMVVAAHNTDYFAKLPGHPSSAGESDYAVVPHDDAKTRGLWSAAGEMSAFFGSEDVPARHEIEKRGGVSLGKVLSFVENEDALLSALTAAWGWTGIIYTRWDKKIAADVPLSEILPTLKAQIESSLAHSATLLKSPARAENANRLGETIAAWIDAFAAKHPSASLTDLYGDLLPRFYALLLGDEPTNLSVSSTVELLRFNNETACLPRFAFVDLFLNPATRKPALNAYNFAVGGSGAYTLDSFGEGALPFDVVIPGRGRGTLAITPDGTVSVLFSPEPLIVCPPGRSCAPSSVSDLARLLEAELGPDITLVGKAVALLPMLAAEYIFAFHEGASSYSDRTATMLAEMRRRNLPVPMAHPILRVQYATWDAIAAVPVAPGDIADALNLPPYLQQTLGRASIGFEDFALCWRRAVTFAERDLGTLRELRSPRDLLSYLAEEQGENWEEKSRQYESARMVLLTIKDKAQAIQGRIYTLYDQVRRLKTEAMRIEREKGDDFRARIQPLRERLASTKDPGETELLESEIESLRAERVMLFDVEIETRRGSVRYALATVRDLKQSRLALERSNEAASARETLRRIESEAETAKAELVANSLRTLHALPHTNYRPSSWLFPLVDPSGAWFARLTKTTELRWEEL